MRAISLCSKFVSWLCYHPGDGVSRARSIGNAAPNNARKGIVGWFPLVPKDVGGSRLTGELKLRFHLKRAHLLEGLDEACRQELIAHPAAYIRVLNRHTSYEPAAW